MAYCAIATAAGLELMVRLLLPQVLPVDAPQIYRPDDTIGWRRNANVRALANTGDRDVVVCTDALGDRISCTEPHAAGCARRILVIGDSFVEALGVPFEETAWARIERDTGACVDVAGVGGYEPSQYLQLLRERVRDNRTAYDLVVASMFVGNDFVSDSERLPPPQSVWKQPVRLLPEGLDADSLVRWLHPYDQWLESRSHAYVALRFAIRNLRDPGDVGMYGLPIALVRDRLTDEILDATTRAFELMAEEVAHTGGLLLVTTVPVRVQVLDPSGTKLRQWFPSLASAIDMDLVGKALVPRLQRITGVVAVVDLLPALRKQATPDYWGVHDQHLSSRGHEVWFAALRGPVRAALGLQDH
jgi:hypothetical protein